MKPGYVPLLAATLLWVHIPLHSADIVALCIGNDAYHKPEDSLDTPVADARLMKEALESLPGGADVKLLTDASRVDIVIALNELKDRARGAKLALVYYSGHGMDGQPRGYQNEDTFLLPVEAVIPSEDHLAASAVGLREVLAALKDCPVTARAVILDCCRSGAPKATGALVAGGTKNFGQLDERVKLALGKAVVPEATLVAFAASPGRKAAAFLNTSDKNSPFTAFLAAQFGSGAGNLRDLVEAAAEQTERATERRQVPYVSYSGATSAIRQIVFREGSAETTVRVEEPDPKMNDAEIERRAKEMAHKLVAEAMGNQGGEGPMVKTDVVTGVSSVGAVSPSPGIRSDPTSAPTTQIPSVMVRTDPNNATQEVGTGSTAMALTSGGFPATAAPPATSLNFVNGQGMTMIWVAETKCWVDKHELVQSIYEAITGTNPSTFKNPKGPVETVSWTKAMEFCEKLTKREAELGKLPAGYKYSLPTDAQWSIFAVGTQLEDSVVSKYRSYSRPEPVGSLRPNPLGLYDMMGNVWEWAYDDYNKEMNRGVSTKGLSGIDKTGKVVRGASYSASKQAMFQIELRAADHASTPDKSVGFRVVLSR